MSKATEKTGRKKLTVSKIDLAKQPAGFSIKAMYVGETLSQPFNEVDEKTGEVVTKTLTFSVFEDAKKERFKVIRDSGLRTALADAMVKENDLIELVKLEKASIGKGRQMNQYDIFALESLT